MTQPEQQERLVHENRQSTKRYRTIEELLKAPNLSMPRPIVRPGVDMMNRVPAEQVIPVRGHVSQLHAMVQETPHVAVLESVVPAEEGMSSVKKYRTLEELFRAPNNPMPPPICPRAEKNAVPVELEVPDGELVCEMPAVQEPSLEDENGFDGEIRNALEGDNDDLDMDNVSDIVCYQCGLGHMEDELLLCDGCSKGYHIMCARPILSRVPNGPWRCLECSVPPQAPDLEDENGFDGVRNALELSVLEGDKDDLDNVSDIVCCQCGLGHMEVELLLCDTCSKGYHTMCAIPILPRVPNGPWRCLECSVPPQAPVENGFDGEIRNALELSVLEEDKDDLDMDNVSDIVCCQCGLGHVEAELLLCDGCSKGYHTMCARPILPRVPNGPWRCFECSVPPQATDLSKSDIMTFFGIQDFADGNFSTKLSGRKRKRGKTYWSYKSRTQWLPYVPSKDTNKRLEQLGSLAKALLFSRIEFADDLLYAPEMAPKSANNTTLDRREVQILRKGNKEIWNLCKAMQRRGACPPLKIIHDIEKGYMVVADATIEDRTFICEHTGFVDYSKNWELDDSNSSMELLSTNNKSKDLIISQQKCGNFSHFLSGINNHTSSSKKKQNCTFIRCNVEGECRVFVVSTRRIKAGSTLYCNYNGGELNAYPTKNFV